MELLAVYKTSCGNYLSEGYKSEFVLPNIIYGHVQTQPHSHQCVSANSQC